MKMEHKITTTKNMNSIAVNAIFSQVFNTDPVQEAPLAHGKMSFEWGYNMIDESTISIMIKKYKHVYIMDVLNSVDRDSLTAENKLKSLMEVILIKIKRSEKLKGRICANGSPHRKFIPR